MRLKLDIIIYFGWLRVRISKKLRSSSLSDDISIAKFMLFIDWITQSFRDISHATSAFIGSITNDHNSIVYIHESCLLAIQIPVMKLQLTLTIDMLFLTRPWGRRQPHWAWYVTSPSSICRVKLCKISSEVVGRLLIKQMSAFKFSRPLNSPGLWVSNIEQITSGKRRLRHASNINCSLCNTRASLLISMCWIN